MRTEQPGDSTLWCYMDPLPFRPSWAFLTWLEDRDKLMKRQRIWSKILIVDGTSMMKQSSKRESLRAFCLNPFVSLSQCFIRFLWRQKETGSSSGAANISGFYIIERWINSPDKNTVWNGVLISFVWLLKLVFGRKTWKSSAFLHFCILHFA